MELALTMARASEAAVVTVGAAAISAAEQAERAAGLAEKASVTALEARDRVAAMAVASSSSQAAEPRRDVEEEGSLSSFSEITPRSDDSLSDFSARADRLVARLRQLQRVPLPAPASGAPKRPQPAR